MMQAHIGSSVSEQLGDFAAGLPKGDLSAEALALTKRLIVDALACGIGGYRSPTGGIVTDWAQAQGGAGEATLIGSGHKVGMSAAIIANQAMVRYLDYNDDLPIPIGVNDLVAAHPSGALPVALCLGEKVGASGRDIIEAIAVGYEVVGRLLSGFRVSLEARKFHHGSTLVYGSVAMAGRLLGASGPQIANAMGVAGSLTVGLDILDADGEEYTMTKNLADGMISERGYQAVELARRGLTGPLRIIEGPKGFAQAVLGGDEMFSWGNGDGSCGPGCSWILHTVIKSLPAEATNHGHLTATCQLVTEHGIAPDDIDTVIVRTNKRTLIHTGDPVKKYPRNKETADHSTYFLTAMAALEGKISAGIYNEDNYTSDVVRAMIDKVQLEYEPEFDLTIPTGETEIRLKDGRSFRRRVNREELVGEPTNRMSDAMLRDKFIECGDGLLSPDRIDDIIAFVFDLENQDQPGALFGLTTV
ncbi:MmgE/PrpD family protein [Acuticoccus mangrovi]|uniref:MmgE/PrpD family protein n=1 Tax=Acuticoccus mangrovi TaxID=2796142 RepID=A0A934ME50_9HYPH|nr:MmgE/PrpD family protein [Acuticoccus mangrovi]MBJ3777102.1 MmgE/PrpD family protein [Acuticoccus mangrovi]